MTARPKRKPGVIQVGRKHNKRVISIQILQAHLQQRLPPDLVGLEEHPLAVRRDRLPQVLHRRARIQNQIQRHFRAFPVLQRPHHAPNRQKHAILEVLRRVARRPSLGTRQVAKVLLRAPPCRKPLLRQRRRRRQVPLRLPQQDTARDHHPRRRPPPSHLAVEDDRRATPLALALALPAPLCVQIPRIPHQNLKIIAHRRLLVRNRHPHVVHIEPVPRQLLVHLQRRLHVHLRHRLPIFHHLKLIILMRHQHTPVV